MSESPDTRSAREAYRDPTLDPTTYTEAYAPADLKEVDRISVHDKELNRWVQRRVYADADGNRYFELTHHPATQQLASRMLKGIVNVADVLKTPSGDRYVSKEMDIERIAASHPDTVYADWFIFNALLHEACTMR